MSDKEISDYPSIDPLVGTELLEFQQGLNSRKGTVLDVSSFGGANVHDRGTVSSGTQTPEPSDGAMQKGVNGGAHTLAAPTGIGWYVLTYLNGATAGVITASGWDRVFDAGGVLAHVVANSVVELAAYNDGVSKRLQVTLVEDATI